MNANMKKVKQILDILTSIATLVFICCAIYLLRLFTTGQLQWFNNLMLNK